MKTYIKSKQGTQLGYRTPDHYKARTAGGGGKKPQQVKRDASQFRIQHKG